MNHQLIEAFHSCSTLSDVTNLTGLSSVQLERIIIDTMKHHYKAPTVAKVVKPITVSEFKSKQIQQSSETNVSGLSAEQLNFINLSVMGETIFLTAPAGYGKSHAIHETVVRLRARYDTNPDLPSRVAITASTGKAASLIAGRTIHSYLGIGLARQSADELYDRLVSTRRLKSKYLELKNLKTLIIDEVSMVNNILMDKISLYLELIKQNQKPFGGVQMIFVGDLHQLAPVEGKYFIESASYKEALPVVIQLTKCFRQTDPMFQQILTEARVGRLSDESFDVLMQQSSIDHDQFPDMKPTLICSTNREVDSINQRELNKLKTEKKTYHIIPISVNSRKIETAAKLEGIVDRVELAVDAQIMITTNISMGGGRSIANGSQGTVLSMYEDHINVRLIGWCSDVKIGFQKLLDPECIDPDNNPVYLFEYLPVRLGWASTVHKAQGMTCDLLEIDLSKIFAAGQGYVAISRVRSLAGLKLTGLKRNAFIADQKILEFYSSQ